MPNDFGCEDKNLIVVTDKNPPNCTPQDSFNLKFITKWQSIVALNQCS